MAHISKLNRSWRAVIRHKDYYASRTFRTREETEAWAAQEEEAYYQRKNADFNLEQAAALVDKLPNVHAKTLRQQQQQQQQQIRPQSIKLIAGLPDREQIVQAAAPYPRAGVYFLLLKGEIVYIGQTTSVIERMAAHVNSAKHGRPFDEYVVLAVPKELCRNVEKHYIKQFQPRYNIHGVDLQLKA